MQLFIDTANTEINVRNRCFNITNKTTTRIISPKRISSISITSNVKLNTSAIKLAAKEEIPIYFYNYTGQLIGQFTGPGYLKHSRLRVSQQKFFTSNEGNAWAIKIIILKTDLQLESLKRMSKEQKKIGSIVDIHIKKIIELKNKIITLNTTKTFSRNTLMALEGNIAHQYYQGINNYLPNEYQFSARSRRPGKDYFNTALNYIYGITYGHITKAIHASGLDTFTGGLHTTPYKEALVYDCIEPFRPIMDRLLFQMCKNQELQDKHFRSVLNGFWLSKTGKKHIITAYVDYLAKRIKMNNKILTIENHMYHFVRDLKSTIQQNTM